MVGQPVTLAAGDGIFRLPDQGTTKKKQTHLKAHRGSPMNFNYFKHLLQTT